MRLNPANVFEVSDRACAGANAGERSVEVDPADVELELETDREPFIETEAGPGLPMVYNWKLGGV